MSIALIVDDDVVARTIHSRVLSQVRSLSVVGAASVEEAKSVLREVSPVFAVVDLMLPDGTGLDVLSALEEHRPKGIVVVSAHLDQFEGMLRCSETIHRLGKPAPHHALIELAERAIGDDPPASGPFTVAEYVQLACLGQHTLELRCHSPELRGRIVVKAGEIWSADNDRGEQGALAFGRLATVPAVRVTVGEAPEISARNVEGSWEGLLLNAIRLQDELAADEVSDSVVDGLGTIAPPPAPEPEDTTAAFDALLAKARKATVARDLTSAVTAFKAAATLDPENTQVQQSLERLHKLGYD